MLNLLPNSLSLLRVLISPLVAWQLYTRSYRAALIALILAGVTDWLDGYAARKIGHPNPAGIIIDPMADKLLLVTVFLTLALLNLVPLWLFVLAAVRDIVIVTGALLLRLLRNRHQFLPSVLGKVSTFFQIVLALLAVLYAAFPYEWLRWLKITGIILTAIFTALSGLDYVRQGIRMAKLPSLERI